MPDIITCEFPGCDNPIRTKTYCNGHRLQYQRGQELRPLRRRGRPADPCTVEGCARMQEGIDGLCSPHKRQIQRTGRTKRVRPIDASPTNRFWWYANSEDRDGCWEWTGMVNDQGYGIIPIGGKHHRAHRFSWEIHHGPIPEGAVLDHFRCYNRRCVNPEHLRMTDKLHNCQNRAAATSKSGYRNVYGTPSGRFSVMMRANHQAYYGGTFDTAEQADERARELRQQVMPGAQW